jgi:hypothetical protein
MTARRVLLATLLIAAFSKEAHAGDDQRGARSGFSFDLRLGAGLATVAYDDSDYPVADFEAVALGAGMHIGGFIGPHVLIGAELALSWGAGVGTLRVHDPSFFSTQGYPTSATYGSFSPLGAFVEVYPWESEGIFVGAAAGVGLMDLPNFGPREGGVMARYAFELGYELGRTGKKGAALYLRYDRWAGAELPISTDYPDGIVSREVLVGVRWTFAAYEPESVEQ